MICQTLLLVPNLIQLGSAVLLTSCKFNVTRKLLSLGEILNQKEGSSCGNQNNHSATVLCRLCIAKVCFSILNFKHSSLQPRLLLPQVIIYAAFSSIQRTQLRGSVDLNSTFQKRKSSVEVICKCQERRQGKDFHVLGQGCLLTSKVSLMD